MTCLCGASAVVIAATPRLATRIVRGDARSRRTSRYLVLAAVASYPHTRARAQSALAARGEEASAAAGIAALVGGHLPEHVMAEGRRRLVCVTLDQVSFEDLADSESNPARSKSARRKPGSVK